MMNDNNYFRLRVLAHKSIVEQYAAELINLLSKNNFQLLEQSKTYPQHKSISDDSRIYLTFIKTDSNSN